MKIPKTFVPEKSLEEKTKKLQTRKDKQKSSCAEKAFLDDLSFEQLMLLDSLEEKLDHLKVDFEHIGRKYQLVYTPGHCNTRSDVQILQFNPNLSTYMITDIVKDFEEYINCQKSISDHFSPAYIHEKGCLLTDLVINKVPLKRLEEYFKKKHKLPALKDPYSGPNTKFRVMGIYAEYHDLADEDADSISLIPKKHRLEKSKTYET